MVGRRKIFLQKLLAHDDFFFEVYFSNLQRLMYLIVPVRFIPSESVLL